MARSRWRHRLLSALLVVAGLVALLYLTSGPRPVYTAPEALIRDAIAPLQSGVTNVLNKFSRWGQAMTRYHDWPNEERQLKRKVADLQRENLRLREYMLENVRLREMLKFKELNNNYDLLPAVVIARPPLAWFRTVTIDQGTADGVAPNMVVINQDGLVGRVTAVTRKTAEVMLIIDQESAVSALTQNTRTFGIVEGVGEKTGLVQMIRLPRDIPIRPNQIVITSGYGGIFPKGLPIGEIMTVSLAPDGLLKMATVRPFVDFNRLEEVMVIRGAQPAGPASGDEKS